MRSQKGITLVALVITIVVMLILVAVTLTIALGQNGIIKKAQDARTNYYDAEGTETNVFSSPETANAIQNYADNPSGGFYLNTVAPQ